MNETLQLIIQAAIILFLFSLIYLMSIIDLKYKIIPNWLNGSIFLLGIFLLLLPKNHNNYIFALISFGLIAFTAILLFYVLGGDAWGGGDAKFLLASGLYLISTEGYIAFVVIMAIVSIIVFTVCKIKQIKSIPYGPVLGAALIS